MPSASFTPTLSTSLALTAPSSPAPLLLRNRLVLASLTRNRAGLRAVGEEDTEVVPNGEMREYYAQRARGGWGLLLTEGTLVEPQGSQWRNAPGIWSAAQVAGWKKVTDAVHAEGGLIFCQLWHVGRISHPQQPLQRALGKPVRAPSTLGARGGHYHDLHAGNVTPEALEDPKEVVEAFRRAAENAKLAGFDGVDVHMANGYLIAQFLDISANQRTDAYGGSVANRLRFAREVLEAVLTVWPADRVGVKVSPIGGYNDVGMNALDTYETFSAVFDMVSDLQLAYIQPVRYLEHEDKALDAREGLRARCQDLDILGRLVAPLRRREAEEGRERRTKVLFNGLFGGEAIGGEEAEAWVADGRADGIVIGRDSITNPDLPFRIFNRIPLTAPGGGPSTTWYAVAPEDGRAQGYTDYGFCAEFAKAMKEDKE